MHPLTPLKSAIVRKRKRAARVAKRREGRGRGEEEEERSGEGRGGEGRRRGWEERSEGTHELTVGRTRWLLEGVPVRFGVG